MSILTRLQRKITGYLDRRQDRSLLARHQRAFFTPEQITPVIRQNRAVLSSVPRWIDDSVYDHSIFQYGLPAALKLLIDKPLSSEVTYTDALCFLLTRLSKPVRYLELGVSVGKNFFQVANSLQNSSLTGFDIEEINPILEARFSDRTPISRWATMETSTKKGESSLTSYRLQSNEVRYLSGDIFDEGSWARLAGEKFNVIFSDAFHSPDALRFEYEMLKRYRLIADEQFIMMWDDLGGGMTREFFHIYDAMQLEHGLTSANLSLNAYRGWLGEYVAKHMIGMIHRL